MFLNIAIASLVLLTAYILLRPAIARSQLWRATVTPLASIIGSGFLISGPLTTGIAGNYAVILISILVVGAYFIGAAIRYNIQYIEPQLETLSAPKIITAIDWLGDWALAFAYIVSIAFYIKLLSAFALKFTGINNELYENLFSTSILLFIGGVGAIKGLKVLEGLEKNAVVLKLAVICGLIAGLIFFNMNLILSEQWALPSMEKQIDENVIRMALGCFIMIQGFETSRYLGQEYSVACRITSMRNAQLISGFIYILFIMFGLTLFSTADVKMTETAIIDYSAHIASILPFLLIFAALAAQFSAATADTLGVGGLLNELTKNRLSVGFSYMLAIFLSILLIWSTNVFEIISYASRAFAVYYALQSLQATIGICHAEKSLGSCMKGLSFFGLTIFCVLIAVYALPIE